MALLYDWHGREIQDGVVKDDIIAAIQAAAIAGEFGVAEEIADRHGWTGLCLCCAIKSATTAHYDRDNIIRRVCITCFHALQERAPSFSGIQNYMSGLIKRDVQ